MAEISESAGSQLKESRQRSLRLEAGSLDGLNFSSPQQCL